MEPVKMTDPLVMSLLPIYYSILPLFGCSFLLYSAGVSCSAAKK